MSDTEPRNPETPAARRSHVSTPEGILESVVLATAEKRRLLLRMIEDEMCLLAADDEGMQGARPTQIDRVRRALRALKA
jgi:hypothetical protein